MQRDIEQSVSDVQQVCQRIRQQVAVQVVGQSEVIDQMLIAMLCQGHCLLVGVPGLAKTLMVQALAGTMNLSFGRIQFTPDLMPTDITGTELIQESAETGQRELQFQAGPLFTNVLLADEINRTPPKTQAALLEAMQERQVTVGARTRELAQPFFVLATQNPIEQEGTYPLPEAQLDRFMFQLLIDYPTESEELEIVQRTTGVESSVVSQVVNEAELEQAMLLVREMPVASHVTQYAIRLARLTRPGAEAPGFIQTHVAWGGGPRSSQYLVLGAKAHALINGRLSVGYEDVQAVAHPVLRHRVRLNYAASANQITVDQLVDRILQEFPPTLTTELDNQSSSGGEHRDQSSKVFRTEDVSNA
jgi:MoxR-like ATPase|tara:strand:+ start:2502 stop:3584 length:1083 start_codon:yes stop_codon:yes gene_type:complete